MSKIISPEQVSEQIKKEGLDKSRFPDYVFEAFNEAIKEAVADGSRTIYRNKIVGLIVEKSEGACTRNEVFDNHWLDVEPIYEKQGWNLQYVKLPYYVTDSDHYFHF